MRFITAAINNAFNSMDLPEFFQWQEAYIQDLEDAGTHPDMVIEALDLIATYIF